jgi:hypothetical protein
MRTKFWLFSLIALMSLSLGFAVACGDDDDDDDDDTADDDADDDVDDDTADDDADDDDADDDDDFTPVGECATEEVYDAISWLFAGECYVLEDNDGNELNADQICEASEAADIACFIDCFDQFDECGGDPDPLYECIGACLA